MTPAFAGGALGALAGTGAWLAVSSTPRARRSWLRQRLEPWLPDVPARTRLLPERRTLTPFPTLERLLLPTLVDLAHNLDRWVGGTAGVRRRLDQLGPDHSLERFRTEQVLWGAAGLAAGLLLAVLGWADGARTNPVAVLATCLALTTGGVLARDRWLSRQVTERDARILTELPTVAELLALAVTAGEGAAGALDRVSRRCHGELTRELDRALAEARAGASLVQALGSVSRRTALPQLARFVEGVTVAVERGTPLADVLRAQAVDVREAGRRALLETAGRREVAMLVPVVFLVLPVTVLFALFPGFYGLRLVAG